MASSCFSWDNLYKFGQSLPLDLLSKSGNVGGQNRNKLLSDASDCNKRLIMSFPVMGPTPYKYLYQLTIVFKIEAITVFAIF